MTGPSPELAPVMMATFPASRPDVVAPSCTGTSFHVSMPRPLSESDVALPCPWSLVVATLQEDRDMVTDESVEDSFVDLGEQGAT